MGTPDEHGRKDAIVCWHCGTLVPLKVKMLGGQRVVVCPRCAKTNSLHAPSGLAPRSYGRIPNDG